MSKKLIALFCACACFTAMAVGCGDNTDDASSAAETTTAAEEVSVSEDEPVVAEDEEEDFEEDLEDESEDESEEALEEDEDEDEDNDDAAVEVVDNGEIDAEASIGSMTYGYCSTWSETGTSSQMNYIMPDNSGAVIFQTVDGSAIEDEEEMITTLADQCKSIWEGYDGMVVLEDGWDESSIAGKKAYVVEYEYEVVGTKTHNITYFFANYNDETKDVFAVTFSALTEDSAITDYAEPILSSISFN